jgi:hypothetical protein
VSRIQYDFFDRKFSESFKDTVAMANTIIREYTKAGFDLTLRQLYYQFVARGYIKNKDTEYKRLGGIINDGRLAGMIDWDAITDRTRYLRQLSHWDKPEDVIRSAACSYRTRKWADQPERVEVWIEKDALIGVIQPVCESLDVPYFSCRGYVSQSEMWAAAQRIQAYYEMYGRQSQRTTIIHLGDHDPSGIDMTRDIEDRISLFLGNSYDLPWKLFDVQRIRTGGCSHRRSQRQLVWAPKPHNGAACVCRHEGSLRLMTMVFFSSYGDLYYLYLLFRTVALQASLTGGRVAKWVWSPRSSIALVRDVQCETGLTLV